MIGEGSIVAIILFAVISVGAVICIFVIQSRRRVTVGAEQAKNEENEEST